MRQDAASIRATADAPLVGACLLSASGSLPSQCLPIVLYALLADGGITAAGAGAVGAALIAGKLVAVGLLPKLRPGGCSATEVLAAIALAACAIGLSARGADAQGLTGWFCLGVSSGLFQFVGLVSASRARHPALAFSIRLALSLLLSGTIIAVLSAAEITGLARTVVALGAVQLLLCLIGAACYARGPVTTPPAPRPRGGGFWVAGIVVFLFFGIEIAFMSFISELSHAPAGESGLLTKVGLARIVTAVLLTLFAARLSRAPEVPRLLALGTALSLCILSLSQTGLGGTFLALLALELSLNLLAPQLLAAVTRRHGVRMGSWLSAFILSGSTLCHAAAGLLISAGLGTGFIALAVAAALLPALWARTAPPAEAH